MPTEFYNPDMGNEFIFEGKKYISASRGAQICGYTADYIGQLCRKNQIDCRRVGRTWFVNEESLLRHKESASSTPRGRIPIYQKNLTTQISAMNAGAAAISAHENSFVSTSLAFKSPYQNSEAFTDSTNEARTTKKFALNLALGVAALIMIFVGAPRLFMSDMVSQINPGTVYGKISVAEKYVVEKITAVANFNTEVKSSLAYSANVYQSIGDVVSDFGKNIYFGARSGLAKINNFFAGTSAKLKFAFSDKEKPVQKNERPGLAVVPSAGEPDANEQVKKYVIDSFSDETEVVPDESGNSGLLKPVFKENNDQEYLYVIVPVKESAKGSLEGD